MYADKIAISIFTVLFLASVLSVAYAEVEGMNGTANISVNISANDTNQSFYNQTNGNSSGTLNRTRNVVGTGGIKNFMKDFKYQSSV